MPEISGLGYVPFYNPDGSIFCTVPVFSLDQSLNQYTGTVITFESASLAELTGLEFNITREVLLNSLNTLDVETYDLSDKIMPSTKKVNSTDYRYGLCVTDTNMGRESHPARLSNDGKWVSWTNGGPIYAIWYHPHYSKYSFVDISINDEGYEETVATGRDFTDYGLTELEIVDNSILPGQSLKELSKIHISPTLPYVEKGGSVQFSGLFKYADGSEEPATSANSRWTLCSNEVSDATEIDGVTINNEGLLTVSNLTEIGMLDVKLYAIGYGKSNSTRVMISGNYKGPYGDGTVSSPSGGGGHFGKNEVSDDVSVDLPLGSVEGDASATGMFTRYLCNSSYLDLIGDWVWDPNLGLSLIQTAIKPLYNDPAQAMISLVSFPFQLSGEVQGVTTRSQAMYFGHQPVMGAQFTAILSSACYIDWGTIDLQEYWGNFLDYHPHTKIEMYLPWGTGFVSIDPGQCLPGTLQVRTNIELARGSCVHNIINSAGCVIGSFAGQCGKQVPLIASDIAAKRAGLVTAAAGLIAGGVGLAAAGTAGTLAAGAAYNSFKPSGPLYIGKNGRPYYGAARMSKARSLQRGAISAAEAAFDEVSGEVREGSKTGINIASKSSIAALKSPVSVQRNGGFTDGSAGMGIQYPYIILSRPEQNVPENYGRHFGYPSNIHTSLLFLKGYTEIGSVHLNGIPATAPELEELDAILKGGVIL